MTPTEKRNRLRAILKGDVCKSPATVWDALSARVAEAAGFECGILSGSVCAATVLGAPDLALQTLSEFAAQVRCITRASDLSLFVDADQGYGNALNAMRTVEELEHAGLAGLAIEDLVMPAHFARHGADELISVQEAVGKLKAALSARRDASLVIAARTASLRIEPMAQVVERARAYAGTGVDALFVTSLKKLDGPGCDTRGGRYSHHSRQCTGNHARGRGGARRAFPFAGACGAGGLRQGHARHLHASQGGCRSGGIEAQARHAGGNGALAEGGGPSALERDLPELIFMCRWDATRDYSLHAGSAESVARC